MTRSDPRRRRLWVTRVVDAPAGQAWELLTCVPAWPSWGPLISGARIDGGVVACGARGEVALPAGIRLPFVITALDAPHEWSWQVAGVATTDHRVDDLGGGTCRVGFGVPWPAAPYLGVCQVALARIAGLLTT
jgi:hypothetical protein